MRVFRNDMSSKTLCNRAVWFSAVLLAPLFAAQAQDIDVPGNIRMLNSTATEGNILKAGIPFIHNFGQANAFLGSNAGNLTMTGGADTAIGDHALFSNTTGGQNTAAGFFALYNNTSGSYNTAVGSSALVLNTTGEKNTAIGQDALGDNIRGSYNTACGVDALHYNDSGNGNTAIGVLALHYSGGDDNTAVGSLALINNDPGKRNTAIGVFALSGNIAGSNNTAIGHSADVASSEPLSNATAIGYGATVDASNKIRLGNADVTVIEGEVPFSWTSDQNKKENFHPVEGERVLNKIRTLKVTSWNYIGQNPRQFRHYGPMGQDFYAAFGHDSVGTIGTPTTITSGDVEGILLVAVQALEKEISRLRDENTNVKRHLKVLERRIGKHILVKTE